MRTVAAFVHDCEVFRILLSVRYALFTDRYPISKKQCPISTTDVLSLQSALNFRVKGYAKD